MRFEYNCPFNLASIIVEELEQNTQVDFITVEKPHYLFLDKSDAKIILYGKNVNSIDKLVKKTIKKIFENLTTLEKNFEMELRQII